MAVALGRRLRRRMPRGGPAEPLGHTRRTIESTGGARSSAPCRSWCGDTGCGVDLLAADELNLKEVRRSRQKSSACWTQSATPPPAPKAPAKVGRRIVREQEFVHNYCVRRGFLCMSAGSATQFSAHLTCRFGAQGSCSVRCAVCDRGGLTRCRCTERGWARLVAARGARIPAGARATPAAARYAWSRRTGKAASLVF